MFNKFARRTKNFSLSDVENFNILSWTTWNSLTTKRICPKCSSIIEGEMNGIACSNNNCDYMVLWENITKKNNIL